MDSKRFLSCKKHQKASLITRFFDDVDIEDEKIKESIMDWILRLNEGNILIKKFSFLFSKYEEIVFPIKVCGVPHHLEITDANENNYYLCYNQYTDITKYNIGKRTKDFDVEFSFLLRVNLHEKKSVILLKNLSIVKLDGNGVNTDTHIKFYYNYTLSSTKAVLETTVNNEIVNLEIIYETTSLSQDLEISIYLFDLAGKSKYISNACLISEELSDYLPKILEQKNILSIYYSKKTDISP